jgi:hypothetical protein
MRIQQDAINFKGLAGLAGLAAIAFLPFCL